MNNRQNGRRRGRGGQQARNGQPGSPSNGSRVDNRARGNAAQLLEKYKNLARDAQMSGDRVNTEYYLQFADHYFRVLNENRARFEEQRPPRQGEYRDEFGEDDSDESNQARADQSGDDSWDEGDAPAAPQRSFTPRRERPALAPAAAAEREGQGEGRRERRPRTPNGNGHGNAPVELANGNVAQDEGDAPGFAPDFMSQRIDAQPVGAPLADSAVDIDQDGEAAKPRRRTRRPRAETPAEA
jgi:hypothetical protein